jgi:hypothetical protein
VRQASGGIKDAVREKGALWANFSSVSLSPSADVADAPAAPIDLEIQQKSASSLLCTALLTLT